MQIARFLSGFGLLSLAVASSGCDAAGKTRTVLYDMGVARDMTVVQRDMTIVQQPDMFVVPDAARDAAPEASIDLGPDTGVDMGSNEPGDNCNAPITREAGSYATQTTRFRFDNDFHSGGGANCEFADGADVVYAINVAAGERVAVRVTPTNGATFDPTLSLIPGPIANCRDASPTCLDSSDSGAAFESEIVEWTNTTSTATTIYAVVDTYEAGAEGDFTLTVYKAVTSPSPGDRCSGAPMLVEGILRQSTSAMSNNYDNLDDSCGYRESAGRDGTYRISVAADEELYVRVASPDHSFDPAIMLVQGPASNCDVAPLVCLDGSDAAGSTGEDEATWRNTTGSAQTVYVIIDSYSAGMGGNFILSTFKRE